MVNGAAARRVDGGRIEGASSVAGAVQCTPRRLEEVEAFVTGRDRNDETAEMAGALAVRGAEPLKYNHFKVPLMKNLVKRAVREARA